MRREVYESGALCSFETTKSCGGQLSQAGTSWVSLLCWPVRTGRAELLTSWLLPTWLRWPSLHSHLDQLSGGRWWQWPLHPLQLLCFHYPSHNLSSLKRSILSWRWGVDGWWGPLLPCELPPWSSAHGSCLFLHSLGSPWFLPCWNLNKEG